VDFHGAVAICVGFGLAYLVQYAPREPRRPVEHTALEPAFPFAALAALWLCRRARKASDPTDALLTVGA
jgi:hypothetical protein